DNFIYPTDHNIKSRNEFLWKLINLLEELFESSNPTQYDLLKNTTQNTSEGFKNLFNCYEIGKNHMHSIYKQDITKTEKRTTKGRRASNIVIEHSSNYKKQESERLTKRAKTNTTTLPNINATTSSNIINSSSLQPNEEECYLQ
ncbi:15085_t:CDS:1, partial [Cetraspora pellucida]